MIPLICNIQNKEIYIEIKLVVARGWGRGKNRQ